MPGLRELICIDGFAGAGKTTYAHGVAIDTGWPVVHMDDLYDGWDGVEAGIDQAVALVRALAQGSRARYRRYDWGLGCYAEEVPIPPTSGLVLEGVGSGAPALDAWRTRLVVLTAPLSVRARRGIERDGPAVAPFMVAFRELEQRLLTAHRTHERADEIVAT